MLFLPDVVVSSRVWLSLELLCIFSVTASALKDFRLTRGQHPSRDSLVEGGLSKTLTKFAHLHKMQRKILRVLNMTSVTPKELVPNRRKARRQPLPLPDKSVEERNINFILAEASDPYRPDTMRFRIGSSRRSHILDVETAVLSVRLRMNKKMRRAMAKRRRRISRERQMLEENIMAACKNKSMNSDASAPIKIGNSTVVIPPCDRKSSRRSLKRKRVRSFMRRWKPKRVKLVVRLLDTKAKKKRRIFSREVLVKKTQMVSIPISSELLRNASEFSNNTITVQILCRQCRRKVLVDKVYKSNKKQRKNKTSKRPRRLNPHRPYLIIQNSERSKKPEVHTGSSRSRRHALNNYCPISEIHSESHSTTTPQSPDTDIECCTERIYITFEELGFSDWIIYPRGFTTAVCLGSCKKESFTSLVLSEKGYVPLEVKNKETASALHEKHCIPLDSSHLDIIYFSNSNTVVSGHLSNIIDNSCGCA